MKGHTADPLMGLIPAFDSVIWLAMEFISCWRWRNRFRDSGLIAIIFSCRRSRW
jgi:hypothetical protein